MSKVMLHTGYLDYESFNEPGDNPVAESRVFDVSTPEKMSRAKAYVLSASDYADFLAEPEAPVEPTVSLSEVRDNPKKVQRLEKAYAKKQAEYEAQRKLFDTVLEQVDGATVDSIVKNVSPEMIDALFAGYVDTMAKQEFAVPTVYFFDVEEPS